MTSEVQQLQYTWARHGMQGRSRFQVTAVSPGLQDLDSPLATLALRLCRYDTPRGRPAIPPRSFGWIDAREHRFLFQRRAAGVDGLGRPGNFAAHVLVLPAAALTSAASLALSQAWPWWQGGPQDSRHLPTLAVTDLLQAASEVALPAASIDLVAVLLAMQWRGRLSADSEDLLVACCTAARVLPECMDGLASFSSYEGGTDSLDWFELVGTGTVGARPTASGPDRQAAAVVLDASAGATKRRLALISATVGSSGVAWRDFSWLACALAQLDQKDADLGLVLPTLARASVAEEVLLHPEGRNLVARALAARDQRVVDALRYSARELPGDLLAELGLLVCESTKSPVDVANVVSGLEWLPMQVLEGYARGLSPAVGQQQVESWPSALLIAAVAGRTWPYPQHSQAVSALVPLASRLVSNRSIAPQDRVVIAVSATHKGFLRHEQILACVLGELELATGVLGALSGQDLVSILRLASPQERDRLLRCTAHTLAPGLLTGVLRPLLDELPLPSLVEVIVQATRERSLLPNWSEFAEDLVLRCVREELADPSTTCQPARLQELAGGVPELRPWQELASHLAAPLVCTSVSLEQARGLLLALPPRQHSLARRYALRQYVVSVRTAGATDRVIRGLVLNPDEDIESLILELLVSSAALLLRARRHASGVPVLQFVLAGASWNARIHREAVALAQCLDEDEWVHVQSALSSPERVIRQRVVAVAAARGRQPTGRLRRLASFR